MATWFKPSPKAKPRSFLSVLHYRPLTCLFLLTNPKAIKKDNDPNSKLIIISLVYIFTNLSN